ncbi:hypothetical protein CO131_01120 [Candidatus Kaiserbacteria bacterium CG_4_9_14_3_um_filter_50_16]|nr:MAG: hypothetical protein CO131_01120 [Candidatus Kaiserbacteria bacterium CG_4_9_14_3_um_filter_50_16]
MDEILIEEKKYISSKRAAKITGYAKDYIGQLCREGRVPARLVGRSWYVLETAIQDHRFGDQKIEQEEKKWETPKYEASPIEILPPVHRPRKNEESNNQTEVSQSLRDSWEAWFDRTEDGTEQEDIIPIPIHTVYRQPPEELLPRRRFNIQPHQNELKEEEMQQKVVKGTIVMRAIHVSGVLFATLATILAVIGSGYFDKYIISNRQVSIITGVVLYNK